MQQMMDETDDLYRTLLAEKESVGVRKPLLRMATRTVKQGISQASYYAGMLFPKRDEQRGDCVRILAYHRINDDQFSLPGISIRVRNFEQQMKFLRLCFDPISLEEAVNLLSRRERLPGRAVVVTFDDGYRDNYLNAWPLLRQLGIPATIFLSVEAIETGGILWFDLITEGFRRTARREADLRCYGMRLYRWRSPRERLAAAQEIIETGKRFPKEGRDCFVRGVLDLLGVPYEEAASRRLMMRWSDVVKMNEKGMSFGSHGMSHTILSGLGKGELEREIALSKEIIRQRTGIDVKLFAYPNGGKEDFNEESIGLLRRYGYISACTLLGGSNYADAHQLCLKRVCVTEGMESSAFGRFSKPLFATMLRKSFGI
jgi:peptidoglycan/xylan/chitin deacetylase (PgdA/CDA1 family)